MNHNRSPIAVAIAATLGAASTTADAADHAVILTSIVAYSSGGYSMADLTSSTATFIYNDVTNLLTQTGGTFHSRWSIVPNVVTLFRHTITGVVIGNGATATAATYVCTNGNFGDLIAESICGNYNYGPNFLDESTISYGPGTAYDRTIGGDDNITGNTIQQNLHNYDGFNTVSWGGTTLVLSNAFHEVGTLVGNNAGYDWTLTANIPIPPAVWLFGSALGVMGVMRRRESDTQ